MRQSVAQFLALGHTLLFLIREWTISCKDEGLKDRIENYVLFLQIINLTLAFEIHKESIDLLGRIMQVFFVNFKSIYPEELVPKFRFMLHIVRNIRRLGPARQHACFRFEGSHAYLKILMTITRNFKNAPLTLCYLLQARLCSRLAAYNIAKYSTKFFNEDDVVTGGPRCFIRNSPNSNLFRQFIDEIDWATTTIMRTDKIIVNRTRYSPDMVFLLDSDKNSLPVFGRIREIFVLKSMKLLSYIKLKTIEFDETMNAYAVETVPDELPSLISIDSLNLPHSLSIFTAINTIPLINNEKVEF